MNSLFASQRPRRVSHPRARLHAPARPSVCAFGESARWRRCRCGAQPRRAPQLPSQQPPVAPKPRNGEEGRYSQEVDQGAGGGGAEEEPEEGRLGCRQEANFLFAPQRPRRCSHPRARLHAHTSDLGQSGQLKGMGECCTEPLAGPGGGHSLILISAPPNARARPSVCAFGESARWRKHRRGAQPCRAPQLPPQQPPSLPTREMAKKAKKAPEEEAPKKGKKSAAKK